MSWLKFGKWERQKGLEIKPFPACPWQVACHLFPFQGQQREPTASHPSFRDIPKVVMFLGRETVERWNSTLCGLGLVDWKLMSRGKEKDEEEEAWWTEWWNGVQEASAWSSATFCVCCAVSELSLPAWLSLLETGRKMTLREVSKIATLLEFETIWKLPRLKVTNGVFWPSLFWTPNHLPSVLWVKQSQVVLLLSLSPHSHLSCVV